MNAPPEEALEMSKSSKRDCRVYVGNLSYDVKYRDLMEFMRGGGLGIIQLSFWSFLEVETEAARRGSCWLHPACSSVAWPAHAISGEPT